MKCDCYVPEPEAFNWEGEPKYHYHLECPEYQRMGDPCRWHQHDDGDKPHCHANMPTSTLTNTVTVDLR